MAKTEETTAVALIGSADFRAVAVIGETGENLMELLRENVGIDRADDRAVLFVVS